MPCLVPKQLNIVLKSFSLEENL